MQSLRASLGNIRAGTGCRHSKRLPLSNEAHCAQQCRYAPHAGQVVAGPIAVRRVRRHRAHRMTSWKPGMFGGRCCRLMTLRGAPSPRG